MPEPLVPPGEAAADGAAMPALTGQFTALPPPSPADRAMAQPGVGGWRPGVRVRSAVAAALVVAVALLVAAGLQVWFLDRSLSRSAQAEAGLRAQQIASELAASGPGPVDRFLRTSRGERSVAQIVDRSGNIVVATANVVGLPRLTAAAPRPGRTARSTEVLPGGDQEDTYAVVARGVRFRGTPYVVMVGVSLLPAAQAAQKVGRLYLAGLPALVLVVGGATYLFVGGALRPVEAIRRRVAVISAQALSERVPEPAVHDEVGRLAITMNDMLERLQRSQEDQRRFVADASHELRSPLATLRSGLELAMLHPDTWTPATATSLLSETERLQGLVDGLVVLARTDELPDSAGRAGGVDLEDVLQEERARVRSTTDLVVEGTVRPVRVHGNPRELSQVVRNLVDNAVQHARRRVTIDLREERGPAGPEAVLTVADDGPGVPAADRERVFERFVRLDAHRSRHLGGSGLGLAIVARLVAGHGGTVTVQEAEGGGAAFEVRLPSHES